MGLYSGVSGAIIVDGNEVSGIKSWSVDIEADALSASEFGLQWASNDAGLRRWTGSIEGNSDDDATQAALADALMLNQTILIDLCIAKDSSYVRGYAKVRSKAPAQSHDALGKVVYNVDGVGAIERYRSVACGPMLLLCTRMLTP